MPRFATDYEDSDYYPYDYTYDNVSSSNEIEVA